jgi:type I restriction enzyme, R subunit
LTRRLDVSAYKNFEFGIAAGLDDPRILQIAPFSNMGTVPQLIKQFGGRPDYERAVQELQTALYQDLA